MTKNHPAGLGDAPDQRLGSVFVRLLRRLPTRLRWNLLRRRFGGAEAARMMGMSVGEDCRILSYQVSAEPWLVTIGDGVTVSSDVLFITHDGAGWLFRNQTTGERPYRYARITIGNDCFVGARAVLMPGVRVGDGSIVAAGSVVHRSVPSGVIVGGNPARIISTTDAFARKVGSWKRTEDQQGETYRQRVDSIVDSAFLPELVPPER